MGQGWSFDSFNYILKESFIVLQDYDPGIRKYELEVLLVLSHYSFSLIWMFQNRYFNINYQIKIV